MTPSPGRGTPRAGSAPAGSGLAGSGLGGSLPGGSGSGSGPGPGPGSAGRAGRAAQRLFGLGRIGYGAVLLLGAGRISPAMVGRPDPPGRQDRRVTNGLRVLGVRELVQGTVLAAAPGPVTGAAGVAVDATHAASMVALAAGSSRYARVGALNALAPTLFAALGWALSRAAS